MITVIEEAESHDLTTLQTVKAELGITDNTQDAWLADAISAASDVVADHCKRRFGLETIEESIRLDRMVSDIVLSRFPVDEIVSVTECGISLDSTSYELDASKGILTRLRASDLPTLWAPRVVVRYAAGYELLDELPYAIERATVAIVKSWWFARRRDPVVRSQEVPDIGSVSYRTATLPDDVIAMLAPHRNRVTR
jgi:hypothetical protein